MIYLWFDTEFTDLDPDKAHLLQAAVIATDDRLRPVTPPREDLDLVVRLEEGAAVSAWVKENLADLLQRCRSEKALSRDTVDRALAEYVDGLAGPPAKAIDERPVLAGNSVYMDMWMVKRMLPEFHRRLNYRLLDVSTLKLLWAARGGAEFDKEDPARVQSYLPDHSLTGGPHDARYDILASIAEFRFYRDKLFLPMDPA